MAYRYNKELGTRLEHAAFEKVGGIDLRGLVRQNQAITDNGHLVKLSG